MSKTFALDEPEVISVVGEPFPISALPADSYRWRIPLSAHPSARWQLTFQDPLGGSGRTLPRMVNFDRGALTIDCDKASLPTWLSFISRWIEKANSQVAGHAGDGLRVVVKLLADCCLWYWELRRGDEIVESSWSDQWVAYSSRADAAVAGARRLTALRKDTQGQRSATAGHDTPTKTALALLTAAEVAILLVGS
jgi:hypothetical protein